MYQNNQYRFFINNYNMLCMLKILCGFVCIFLYVYYLCMYIHTGCFLRFICMYSFLSVNIYLYLYVCFDVFEMVLLAAFTCFNPCEFYQNIVVNCKTIINETCFINLSPCLSRSNPHSPHNTVP